MTVYLANIALLLLWAALFLWQKPSVLSRRLFCVLASVQMILMAGLRHISVGPDTYSYKVNYFDPLVGVSWDSLFARLWAGLLGQPGIKDPGYALLVKAFQLFSHDYQLFLVFVAMAFIVPLGMLIYRHSSEPLLSFLIYSVLFYNVLPETATRQTIAVAMVVLVGYEFVRERRLLPFLLLSAVAFTIHKSSICFLPFYFVAPLEIKRKYMISLLAAVPVIYVFRAQLMLLFGSLLGYEQYTSQWAGAGAWVFASMLILVVLVALGRLPTILRDQPEATTWFNAVLVALALTPLVFVDPVGMRIVQYYSLFLLLLVPAVLSSFRDKYLRALVYLVAGAFLVVLFARVNPQYLFLWQAP